MNLVFFFEVASAAEDEMIRLATGLAVVGALAWTTAGTAAHSQQIEEQPLVPPAAAAGAPGKQIVQLHEPPDSRLTTQDCVSMTTADEITDCLNRLSEGGHYMPLKPAAGTDLPTTYRLPLGQRQLDAPP